MQPHAIQKRRGIASRRNTRRAPAEERLIDATLALVRHSGIQSLTTVALARAAGIHQPNFYAYFKNVDDCLAAAARHVMKVFLELDVDAFQRVREAVENGLPYVEENCRYHERLMDQLLAEPNISEMFLRHRHDQSPFGRVLRQLEQQTVDKVCSHLWDWAVRAGIRGRHYPEVRLLAEFHVSAFATAALTLLEGRAVDRRAVAVALAYNADATIRATFRRLLEADAAPGA